MATGGDIGELEHLQGDIEADGFADPIRHSDLDTRFHTLITTGADHPRTTRTHRAHQGGEADEATALAARHVDRSGLHILEQMRALPAARAG